jgi:hypothetical protein
VTEIVNKQLSRFAEEACTYILCNMAASAA